MSRALLRQTSRSSIHTRQEHANHLVRSLGWLVHSLAALVFELVLELSETATDRSRKPRWDEWKVLLLNRLEN